MRTRRARGKRRRSSDPPFSPREREGEGLYIRPAAGPLPGCRAPVQCVSARLSDATSSASPTVIPTFLEPVRCACTRHTHTHRPSLRFARAAFGDGCTERAVERRRTQVPSAMDIAQIFGDYVQLLGMAILLAKICLTRNCAGECAFDFPLAATSASSFYFLFFFQATSSRLTAFPWRDDDFRGIFERVRYKCRPTGLVIRRARVRVLRSRARSVYRCDRSFISGRSTEPFSSRREIASQSA